MSKNDLLKIESGEDVCRHIENHKLSKNMHWAGDHLTADGPDGRITASRSRYEYPPWLRKKIVRQLIAIGLGVILVAILVSASI